MEDEEALEGVAVVYAATLATRQPYGIGTLDLGKKLTNNTTNTIHDAVDHLLPNGVVATGVVVGRIFLAADQQFGVKELTIVASADLVNRGRVQINEDGARHVLSGASLGEEGLERTRLANIGSIGVGETIGAKAVLEEVAIRAGGSVTRGFGRERSGYEQLPGRVAELNASLAQVQVKNLVSRCNQSWVLRVTTVETVARQLLRREVPWCSGHDLPRPSLCQSAEVRNWRNAKLLR